MLMSKSCKPLHPGLFLLGAATAALVFAAPQTCAEAFRQGLALCGGPLLVSLFPFLVVSALIMRSGAGEVLGVLLWPVVRCIGLRSRSAGSVLLIGLVGGFAPAATATAEAVRSSPAHDIFLTASFTGFFNPAFTTYSLNILIKIAETIISFLIILPVKIHRRHTYTVT